ncbi:hypothetical protein, partial [Aeromonas jandaei]|uniref:hypothetical protein n=1 Tax=Aeromonas jandaei TaxID=650 RepID=UPI002B05D48D
MSQSWSGRNEKAPEHGSGAFVFGDYGWNCSLSSRPGMSPLHTYSLNKINWITTSPPILSNKFTPDL